MGYANRMGSYKTRIEYEFIRRHIPPAPAHVLDIAGGSGRFATKLLNAGYDVTVNDVDEQSLHTLQERCFNARPKVLLGDFLTTQVPGQFDCALAMECLDRMPFEHAVARAYALLRRGGIFVLTALNSGSWRFAARRILGRAPEIEYVMNTRSYAEAFTRAGFDILALRGLMWMPFVVNSNSPLVPLFENVERVFRLSATYSQSPWLLIAARRRE
jgi:2-polyprenyl-3-methyl-5-hydroxy-6-metoxy-1,4-benzoquinol methylase